MGVRSKLCIPWKSGVVEVSFIQTIRNGLFLRKIDFIIKTMWGSGSGYSDLKMSSTQSLSIHIKNATTLALPLLCRVGFFSLTHFFFAQRILLIHSNMDFCYKLRDKFFSEVSPKAIFIFYFHIENQTDLLQPQRVCLCEIKWTLAVSCTLFFFPWRENGLKKQLLPFLFYYVNFKSILCFCPWPLASAFVQMLGFHHRA